MYGPEWEFDLLREAQEEEKTMGAYDGMKFPKESKWHTRSALVKVALGTFLVGLLLGLFVGVASAGLTTNRVTKTVSIFIDKGEWIENDMPCRGLGDDWTYEIWIRTPAGVDELMHPKLVEEGRCPNAN